MDFDYKEVNNCELCDKVFNLTRVRHKCKRCRLIICSDCGLYKNIIYVEGDSYGESHRVCNPCTVDINFRTEFEKINKPSWNMTSKIGKEWYQLALDKGTVDDYESQLIESKSSIDISKALNTIKLELKNGKFEKKLFNFSVTEFLNNSQLKTEADRVRINIKNVLSAFHCKTKLPYNNIIPYIVIFLLTLTEEANAYTILMYLYEKILPKNFWAKGEGCLPYEGFQKEKWIIRSFLEDRLMFNSNYEKTVYFMNFNNYIDSLLGGLMVNSCNLEVLIQVWTKMIQGTSFRVMENYIIKLLWNMQGFMEKSSQLNIKNLQVYASRTYLIKTLEETNIEYNTKSKIAYDSEWEKRGQGISLEKFGTLQRAYTILREFKTNQIEEFYANLQGHAMTQSGSRRKTMSTTGYFYLTKENFTNFLKMVNDVQAGIIYDAIDYNESKFIGNHRFRCIAEILVTEGEMPKKVNQIFKIKAENKDTVDSNIALEVVDFLEEALNFINQYLFTFNFKYEMYILKNDLIKACKIGKPVSSNEIIDCLKLNLLSEVIMEITGYSTFLDEYEKMAKKDDQLQLQEWKDKYHGVKQELAEKDMEIDNLKILLEAQNRELNEKLKERDLMIMKYDEEIKKLKTEKEEQVKNTSQTMTKLSEEHKQMKKEYDQVKSMESLYLQEIKTLKEQVAKKK